MNGRKNLRAKLLRVPLHDICFLSVHVQLPLSLLQSIFGNRYSINMIKLPPNVEQLCACDIWMKFSRCRD